MVQQTMVNINHGQEMSRPGCWKKRGVNSNVCVFISFIIIIFWLELTEGFKNQESFIRNDRLKTRRELQEDSKGLRDSRTICTGMFFGCKSSRKKAHYERGEQTAHLIFLSYRL